MTPPFHNPYLSSGTELVVAPVNFGRLGLAIRRRWPVLMTGASITVYELPVI